VLGVDVVLEGGAGNDSIEVGDGDLDLIGGNVTVDGGAGVDSILLSDQNDLGEDAYAITFSTASKLGLDVEYLGVEELTLSAGAGADAVDVHSTSSQTAVVVLAGGGDDVVRLSPAVENMSFINGPLTVQGQGGEDRVELHDDSFVPSFPVYTLTPTTVDRPFFGGLTYLTTEEVELYLGPGDNPVDVTEPPSSDVTISGGGGEDVVRMRATVGNDHVTAFGQALLFSTGSVTTTGVESRTLKARAGNDVLLVAGVAALAEAVHVQTLGLNRGELTVTGAAPLTFRGTEAVEVRGNPGDGDTLTFAGTTAGDRFVTELAAAGTGADPVLELVDPGPGTTLLTLIDYEDIDVLHLEGQGGADRFKVYTSEGGPAPGRNLSIDGGPANDKLRVFQTGAPMVDHDPSGIDPDAGVVDVVFALRQFHIDYDHVEQVVLP
jgi:hypothetical protein